MYNINTKFKYFHSVLKEVIYIIECNTDLCVTKAEYDKLYIKIEKFIYEYNSKNGALRLGISKKPADSLSSDDVIIIFHLSDYVRGKGSTKLFQEEISFKSIFRAENLKTLLNELNKK